MNHGLLFFHQGWTDIINCLPLINIYAEKYKRLFVLAREDASPMILFYVRGLRNVVPIFKTKQQLDTIPWFNLINTQQLGITRFELIAHYDHMRLQNDPYNGAYMRLNKAQPTFTFERLFYESYGLPYSDRVDKFTLYRNPDVEEQTYNRLVKKEPYICVHNYSELGNINTSQFDDMSVIELDKSSYMFFDMIRVLQHAKEIHLADSVWAAVCYMIDARYGLLQDVPVYVYCFRDFYRMFTEPKKLSNWNIIMKYNL
jgi:hypothetical protein